MSYTIRKRILQIPTARIVKSWSKKVKVPGDHLSLYQFGKIFVNNLQKDEIMDRANGVAYNFVLAIFPTIIFLFTFADHAEDQVFRPDIIVSQP